MMASSENRGANRALSGLHLEDDHVGFVAWRVVISIFMWLFAQPIVALPVLIAWLTLTWHEIARTSLGHFLMLTFWLLGQAVSLAVVGYRAHQDIAAYQYPSSNRFLGRAGNILTESVVSRSFLGISVMAAGLVFAGVGHGSVSRLLALLIIESAGLVCIAVFVGTRAALTRRVKPVAIGSLVSTAATIALTLRALMT